MRAYSDGIYRDLTTEEIEEIDKTSKLYEDNVTPEDYEQSLNRLGVEI